jgi:hypothetical protein
VAEVVERDYDRLHVPEDAAIVRDVLRAARQVGAPVIHHARPAAAAMLTCSTQKGLQIANLGTGMLGYPHAEQYLLIDEFIRSAPDRAGDRAPHGMA